ncbi:MAG: 8-oxo-dGTP diphosphatase [Cellvibrionaceae bacterium]|jgi:8-oxo-dGTP diphosphatase
MGDFLIGPHMLVEDNKGGQLLDWVELDEHADLKNQGQMAFALTAVFHKNQPLLVFNNWRKYWEIPGGSIDPGESALEAAHRELFEESGQVVKKLNLFAKLKCKFTPQTTATWGILYGNRSVPLSLIRITS